MIFYTFGETEGMNKIYYFILLIGLTHSAQGQIVNIPDAAFKNALVSTTCVRLSPGGPFQDADTNNDGEIQVSEAQSILYLNLFNQNIVSLEGVGSFTAMTELHCLNGQLTTADFTNLPLLANLELYSNELTSIVLPPNAEYVNLGDNNLTSFIIPLNNPNLHQLDLSANEITGLNVSGSSLLDLDCSHNNLTALDLTGSQLILLDASDNLLTTLTLNPGLQNLSCSNNNLTALDLTGLTLNSLKVAYNQLTQLDIPQGSDFHESVFDISGNLYTSITFPDGVYGSFICNETQLTSIKLPKLNFGTMEGYSITGNEDLEFLDMRNGSNDLQTYDTGFPDEVLALTISNNPNLQTICLDDFEGLSTHLDQIQANNNEELLFTNYCAFTPGGNFHTISGTLTLDCAGEAVAMPNTKLEITGSIPGHTFTDSNGHYLAYCGNGNVTVTPIFESTALIADPVAFTQTFSGNGSAVTTNFCVSASQMVHDVDVSILPLGPARPGFDAQYKIVLHNKGFATESGTVSINFQDDVLDFISATPSPASQALGTLDWNYNALQPFSSREFDVVFNVNSPVETPPVNIDDMLSFAIEASVSSDAFPADNTTSLAQTVVGSFDPNDKAVSEGETIKPQQIGDYLHYTIRFQNTGNFAAENVVVKDILADNLDKTTLQMVSASHNYRSTLTNGNKLEFFFENIQLPGAENDEPNSHGYVSFKIRPMANVALHDVIQNSADIYFDFNAPITTNPVMTTISQLAVGTVSHNSFTLSPNPAHEFLTVNAGLNIDSVSVFDLSGKLLLTKNIGDSHIRLDISALAQGCYLMEISNSAGRMTQKFVKI